jgi:hypothetical protein
MLMGVALSDERTGLSFTNAAGSRQRSHSEVRAPRDDDHILLSQMRDYPNLEPTSPFMSLTKRVAQL